ncbi:DNA-binding transcriptional regulator, GntR family [Amycolatopsis pretoriensis]|uniref:DNA-binding transcriptional regulator, GntR family n=1 Tax=Amycolatopsis pretoriensis TaxID=218821 RepID=A0A1H5R1F1_9PSEU|nr:GntR family transcriptional regulator [Amycolatopsis pretoriensis]SEF32222.1 DNA-binding transcriptional regulator, GntR family [Amycolatopsis pretoriensis]
MAPTPLTRQVAARILDYIRDERADAGTRLVERTLAEHLRVSRSPVRNALRLLEDTGVVAPAERGGYTVVRTGEQLDDVALEETSDDETLYLLIAADRLDGKLPDRVTESALARQYNLSPADLNRTLRRISAEGWIERLPGYGWEFQPALTSERAYADSYRYRLIIEPAAILEPTFVLDRRAIEEVRAQQQKLADGAIYEVGNAELFALNRAFHEAIMECSANTFLIEGLRRIDNLRRLIEYRRSLERDRALIRCREHVEIADLLLAGRRGDAAERMREHLSTVGEEKVADSALR